MKTAISLPDRLFAVADTTAKRLGMSRSQFYARAVQEYVDSHTFQHVRQTLDQVYRSEASALDPVVALMQTSSLGDEPW